MEIAPVVFKVYVKMFKTGHFNTFKLKCDKNIFCSLMVSGMYE